MNKQISINWHGTLAVKQVVWDLAYSRNGKLREDGRKMTFEEQRYMIQELFDRLQSEKKEKKELQDLVLALNTKSSVYEGFCKQIEEQQKIIDEQLETIESQKKKLRDVVLKMCNPKEPFKTFDRALGDVFECPECSVIIEPNVNFCEDCGAKISWGGK